MPTDVTPNTYKIGLIPVLGVLVAQILSVQKCLPFLFFPFFRNKM